VRAVIAREDSEGVPLELELLVQHVE